VSSVISLGDQFLCVPNQRLWTLLDFAQQSAASLESLSQVAADRLGPEDRLAAAFREERDGFYTGAVIDLDEILIGPGDRGRFVTLLDEATDRLVREQVFTEYGREWVATEIRALRDRLAKAGESAVDA
jgi:hypothetical protein